MNTSSNVQTFYGRNLWTPRASTARISRKSLQPESSNANGDARQVPILRESDIGTGTSNICVQSTGMKDSEQFAITELYDIHSEPADLNIEGHQSTTTDLELMKVNEPSDAIASHVCAQNTAMIDTEQLDITELNVILSEPADLNIEAHQSNTTNLELMKVTEPSDAIASNVCVQNTAMIDTEQLDITDITELNVIHSEPADLNIETHQSNTTNLELIKVTEPSDAIASNVCVQNTAMIDTEQLDITELYDTHCEPADRNMEALFQRIVMEHNVMPTSASVLTSQPEADILSVKMYDSGNASYISDILGDANSDLYTDNLFDVSFDRFEESYTNVQNSTEISSSMIIADLHDVDGVGQVSMQSPSFSVSESAACIAASDLPDDPTNTKRPRILLHLTRKRTQNKEYWTCNVRKKSRQAGLEYISKGGAVTPARFGTIKSLKNCHDKCKFKCAMKISESTRLQIHVDFWQHSDDGKAHYYVQTVTRAPRKYGESSRRKFSYKYSMFDGSQLVRVCKVFYLTTLNVSQRRIGYALSVKVNPCSGIIRDDRRGRHHRHRVISVARKNEVRIHIKSLPTMESHYRRASSKKRVFGNWSDNCKVI